MATELTKLSQIENRLMFQLTEKMSRDTETVKTLTLLALIFLPASFITVSVPLAHPQTEATVVIPC